MVENISGETWKHIMNSLPFEITYIDKDDRIIYFNKEGINMTKPKKQFKTIFLLCFISFMLLTSLNTTKNSIKVQSIEIKESKIGKKTVIISVRPQDRGKAIGKDGSMIRKLDLLETILLSIATVLTLTIFMCYIMEM